MDVLKAALSADTSIVSYWVFLKHSVSGTRLLSSRTCHAAPGRPGLSPSREAPVKPGKKNIFELHAASTICMLLYFLMSYLGRTQIVI